jgi:excisionase family DNA binding protein
MNDGKNPTIADRLENAFKLTDNKRKSRVEQVRAKTGNKGLSIEQSKLTQQEAAAYCGVSTATIHRWTKKGLKTVSYGNRKRFLVDDLQDYMNKNK